jgi:hypothetical protein
MIRRRLLDDIKVIADGGDPKALVRDAEVNECVELPIIGRATRTNSGGVAGLRLGPGQRVDAQGFVFLYGQPPEVTAAYREAMGLPVEA